VHERGRDERIHLARLRPTASVCLLILAACGGSIEARLDDLHKRAMIELRQGNNADALTLAERGKTLGGDRPDSMWMWKFRLLHAEALSSLGRADDALIELSQQPPGTPEFTEIRARLRLRRGRAYMAKGKYGEAGEILAEAAELGAQANAGSVVAEAETFRGACLLRMKHTAAGEAMLERALARAHGLRDDYLESGILLNLGFLRQSQFRYDEAAAIFHRVATLTKDRARVLHAQAMLNLSICQARLGEFDAALESGREATLVLESAAVRVPLQQSLGEMGNTYLLKGEPSASIPYLKRALATARELKRSNDAAIWAGSLASAYTLLSDWDSAEQFNGEATRIKTEAGATTLVYNTVNSARIAMGRGSHNAAIHLYQTAIKAAPEDPSVLWDSHAGLGAVYIVMGDKRAAGKHFEAALAVIEKTRAQLLRTDSKVTLLSRLIHFYWDYVELLVDNGQPERALTVANSSRTQLLGAAGAGAEARTAPEKLRLAARRSNAIFLSYWLAPKRAYVWVVTANGIICLPLSAPAADIARMANEYRWAVEESLADPMRSRQQAGARLYEVLIAPVRRWIPAGTRVVVVPDGALHNLSLDTLPIYEGARPRYLIEDVVLSVAPAVPAATLSRPKPPDSVLLIGDPDQVDPEFPKLRYAGREIDGIATQFERRAVVLRGSGATPGAFHEHASHSFSAIHFTVHATANRESPLDSALILSAGSGGYKLYARELLQSRLAPDLITVSACRGAGARTYSGEGLVGFAWALLHAGARNVIAGLWDVNDLSTAELMVSTYSQLAVGAGPAAALRDAKLRLIHSEGNFRKPYYWGPFQHYVAPR